MPEPKSVQAAHLAMDLAVAKAALISYDNEHAALLDYLRGEWVDCTHGVAGLPGCPTCEGRWSDEVRRVVQGHRDRVQDEISELGKQLAERDLSITKAEARVAKLEAHVNSAAGALVELDERIAELEANAKADDDTIEDLRRERDEASGEVVRLRSVLVEAEAEVLRSVASADPSSERTQRAVVHLLESLGREIGDDSVASGVVEALAVLLGVDRG